MSNGHRFAAVDLGASSGRVVVGEVGPDRLDLHEVHRFWNGPVAVPAGAGEALHWDVLGLWREVRAGLTAAARTGALTSVGVDTWAVDYGLLDADGALLGNPRHYRDARTDGVPDAVHARTPFAALYDRNGLQFLPFTTLYQLAAAAGSAQLAAARRLLLVPDLLNHWLSGHVGAERTNASTTGLLDVRTGEWSPELLDVAGIGPDLMAPLHDPGADLGRLRPALGVDAGLVAVGSHDTASAVVGVPAATDRFAYIACGTWGLVGVELPAPVLGVAAREANFTNERGVDGRFRFLRNVMGLWLVQECLRAWSLTTVDLPGLLSAVADVPRGPVFDVDAPEFLPPGDMPARVVAACVRAGGPPPHTRPQILRAVLDSLAEAFARAVADAAALAGQAVEVVHLVGGGARNELLCRLTARACGLPVVAGPVEATASGNLLVQARAAGVLGPDLADLRDLVCRTQELRRYEP